MGLNYATKKQMKFLKNNKIKHYNFISKIDAYELMSKLIRGNRV